ncbi:MAG: type IX secretion system membrane protein PorP/SprF [Bacteroidota bacterium]
MKKIYLVILFFSFSVIAFAQQESQFTQNMFTNMFINPGYAGINKQICLTTLYRQQWTGFTDTYTDISGAQQTHKGAPQTILLSVDAPIRALRGGIGLSIFSDKLGFESNLGVKLAYSYHQPLPLGVLGIGIQVGFLNKTIDFTNFNPIQADDPLLMNQTGKKSTFITDIAAGLFYNIPGKAYVGISSTQLIQSKIKVSVPNIDSKLKRTYYLTGAYHWTIPGAPNWELSPYLLIKTDFASAQYDITAMCKWKNMIWGGISYRVQDAFAIILGAYPFNQPSMKPALQQLRIGYSYDITTSALGKGGRSSGTHEIMLGYCFKIVTNPKITKYLNVRFF